MGKLVLLLIPLVAIAPSLASGVSLSPNTTGQAAIVPVYSTEGGLDSLFRVSKASGYSATRIQFWSHQGDRLLSLNLYLAPFQSWEVALTSNDLSARLTVDSEKCVLHSPNGENAAVVEQVLELDASVGYIEVLSMGQITSPEVHSKIDSGDCQSIALEFQPDGLWASNPNNGLISPSADLSLDAQLINVERGTLYDAGYVALRDFRASPYHVPPQDAFGLDNTSPSSSDPEVYESTACLPQCKRYRWDDPRDAVSSLFLASFSQLSYVVSENLRASSSFVLLNPTHAYYPQSMFQEFSAGIYVYDSDLGAVTSFFCTPGGPLTPIDLCPPLVEIDAPNPMSFFWLSSPAPDSIAQGPSPIIGGQGTNPIYASLLDFPQDSSGQLRSGTIVVGILNFFMPEFITLDGEELTGFPLIGVGFTEYRNGTLVSADGSLIQANYGVSQLSRSLN